jgi:hypothetical protein
LGIRADVALTGITWRARARQSPRRRVTVLLQLVASLVGRMGAACTGVDSIVSGEEYFPAVSVILISGNGKLDDGFEVLPKPFSPGALLQAVRSVLARMAPD